MVGSGVHDGVDFENGAGLGREERGSRGGIEPRKKLNKLRSIRLSKVRSLKQSKRWVNYRIDRVLSPIPTSDASPNYMKATNSSSARKEIFQASPRNSESSFVTIDSHVENSNNLEPNIAFLGQELIRRSSFKPIKGLTRMSSLKSKRPLMKKCSGGSEMKRKINKSRSVKLSGLPARRAKNQCDPPAIALPGDSASPQKMSSTSRSDSRKVHFQASPRNYGSGFSSNTQNKKNLESLKPKFGYGQKILMRKSSLRPVRILTKMSSLRPKRPTMRRQDRATCSSTLKNSKFPDHLELHPGENECERTSVMKVCTYSYCSLHGHCRPPLPPLRRFVSVRRRRLWSIRKSKKQHSGDLEKEIQAYKMAFNIGGSEAESPRKEEAGKDFFVEIYTPKGASNGEGTQGGGGEATSDHGSFAEVLVSETLFPQIPTEEENLRLLGDFQAAKGQNASVRSQDCRSIKMGFGKPASEANDADWKEEKIVASNLHSKCTDSVGSCSLEGEDTRLCYDASSKPDDAESISPQEVAIDPNVLQVFHEESASGLNSECNCGASESDAKKTDDSAGATGESSGTSRNPSPEDFAESTTINSLVSSAPVGVSLQTLTIASEEKHEVSEPDHESRCPPAGDSVLPCIIDEATESQLEKQKFMRMWRLIYQHMVSGTAAKIRAQMRLDGADEEKQQNEVNSLAETNFYGTNRDFSRTHQGMGTENKDSSCQKIELYQLDAIKMVEEAIDGILLPEQDHSSDDHSITGNMISDQELLETNHCADKEPSISVSTGSDDFRENEIHSRTANPEETLLKDENTVVQEEEKKTSMVENKSNQKMPKSWSNLKKVILLKKFIKAVEKVRKFNPREPRYLPLEPNSEAEKVYLRHLEMEGRRNAEEWMLDYALQQVVSKLTPARKRKVALLVEAFEAVIPLQEIDSPIKLTSAFPSLEKPVHASMTSSGQGGEAPRRENDGAELSLKEYAERASDFLTVEQYIPAVSSELQESNLDCFCTKPELENSVLVTSDADGKREEITACSIDNGQDYSILTGGKDSGLGNELSTCCQEVLVDRENLQEVHQEMISSLKAKSGNDNPEANVQNLEIGNLTDESSSTKRSSIQEDSEGWTAINRAVSSASVCESVEELPVVNEKINGATDPDYENLQGNLPPGDSERECKSEAAHKNQMDKQKYNRMWYFIYQHLVSGIGENVGAPPLLDDANTMLPQGASETGQNKSIENHEACSEDIELRQIDAIKLVQEAIDEILSPESQDQTLDNPSSTGDIIAEKEVLEENRDVEDGRQSNSASNSSDEDGFREFGKVKVNGGKIEGPNKMAVKADNITTPEEKKAVSKVGNKSNRPASKNWSNLKKLILLKRFVKALEKVKKFNPRGPRFLPLEPDPEAEKIYLRHQTMEERKNCEEWMLDHALQQVVNKLSPARRRRVELLVEAFETVAPLSQTEAQKRHNSAVPNLTKPLLASTWPPR